MKTFEVIWRRNYEVRHRMEIEAKNEESARKKFDKISDSIGMDDHVMDSYPTDHPDDILIYEPRDT